MGKVTQVGTAYYVRSQFRDGKKYFWLFVAFRDCCVPQSTGVGGGGIYLLLLPPKLLLAVGATLGMGGAVLSLVRQNAVGG